MGNFETPGEAKALPESLISELADIANEFCNSIPESIETIEDLLRSSDRTTNRNRLNESIVIAHRIRGSAGTLGLNTICGAFASLEDQLRLIQQKNLLDEPTAQKSIQTTIDLCKAVSGASSSAVLDNLASTTESHGDPNVRLLTAGTEQEEVERIKENHGEIVLLVEDDPFFISIIQSVLGADNRFNKGILSARTLAEAIEFLNQFDPDIILLDLALPDSEGLKTFQTVHELAPDVPILILTALDDTPLADQSVACGAQDYLVKGRISPDALTRCIRYSIARFKAEKSGVRLQAIEDFHSALAHDLRVPVQGADRILEHILAGQVGEVATPIRTALQVLNDSNKTLLNRLNKLLNLYRVEFGNVDADWMFVEPAGLMETIIENRKIDIEGKNLVLDISNWDRTARTFTDPVLLSEVLDELLTNAIKFATVGDTISIKIESMETRVAIKISNPGQHIAKEEKRDLFRKFWKGTPGKSYVANNGLGLYYCHQILNLLKGTISCRSNPNLTTFTVRLPIMAMTAD